MQKEKRVNNVNNCQAVQHSDQKVCTRCGLCWDMNDPDPPQCKTAHDLAMDAMRKDLGIFNIECIRGGVTTGGDKKLLGRLVNR